MLGLVHPLMRLRLLLELSNWCFGNLPGQIYLYYLLTWSMVVDISFTGMFREPFGNFWILCSLRILFFDFILVNLNFGSGWIEHMLL